MRFSAGAGAGAGGRLALNRAYKLIRNYWSLRFNNRKDVDIFAKTIGRSPMQHKQLTADE